MRLNRLPLSIIPDYQGAYIPALIECSNALRAFVLLAYCWLSKVSLRMCAWACADVQSAQWLPCWPLQRFFRPVWLWCGYCSVTSAAAIASPCPACAYNAAKTMIRLVLWPIRSRGLYALFYFSQFQFGRAGFLRCPSRWLNPLRKVWRFPRCEVRSEASKTQESPVGLSCAMCPVPVLYSGNTGGRIHHRSKCRWLSIFTPKILNYAWNCKGCEHRCLLILCVF